MGTKILFDFLISLIKCANEEFSTKLTGTSTCSRKKAPRCKMGPFLAKSQRKLCTLASSRACVQWALSANLVSSSVENEMSQISPLTLKR